MYLSAVVEFVVRRSPSRVAPSVVRSSPSPVLVGGVSVTVCGNRGKINLAAAGGRLVDVQSQAGELFLKQVGEVMRDSTVEAWLHALHVEAEVARRYVIQRCKKEATSTASPFANEISFKTPCANDSSSCL